MEIKISDISLPSLTLTRGNVASVTNGLKVGAILQAMVISNDSQGNVVLKAGELILQTQSKLALTPGQTLNLRVEQLGTPVQLKILPNQIETPQQPSKTLDTNQITTPLNLKTLANQPDVLQQVTHTLRQLLPKQAELTQLLANVSNLVHKSSGTLPDQLQTALKQFADNLTSSKKASTPDGLRQALKDSGLFFELKQLQASPSAPSPLSSNDLKAALIRLLVTTQQLQSSSASGTSQAEELNTLTTATSELTEDITMRATSLPLRGHALETTSAPRPSLTAEMPLESLLKELKNETQQGLARLQLLQTAMLPTPDQPNPTWTFELPIRHQSQLDLFKLRIGAEEHQVEGQQQRGWHIQLAFDLESLGPVHAHVHLLNGSVSANIWAEQPHTSALFSEHMAGLRQRLLSEGLMVGDFLCQTGKPPLQPTANPFDRTRIIDLQA